MGEPVRLFGRLRPVLAGRGVQRVRLRLVARSIPDGAHVDVSDVQLQPGRHITGWVLHNADMGLRPVGGWELRNGIMRGPQVVVVPADVEQASPLRIDAQPLNGAAAIRAGRYLFGHVGDAARVDGLAHTATQGAGIAPHLTARADIDLEIEQPPKARSRVLVWMRGITKIDDDTLATETQPPELPPPLGVEPDPGDEPGTPDPNDPPDDEEEL